MCKYQTPSYIEEKRKKVEGCGIITRLQEESGACYLRCNLPQNKEEKC